MTIPRDEVMNLGTAQVQRLLRAMRSRDGINRAIANLEAKKSGVEREIGRLLGEPSRATAPAQRRRTKPRRRVRAARSTVRRPAKLLSHYMQEVFEKHGKPLRVAGLVDRVFAAGYRTQAKDARRSTYNGILLAVKANPEVFRKAGPGMVELVTREPAKAR